MAISDDPVERDPQLARLLEVAGGELPSPTLDATLLAAARREVGAGPQVVGGAATGGVVRSRRNWYVPVSIAAVMVLSVSVVTLVHEEKGGELAQPPNIASAPAPARAPAPAPALPAAEVPPTPAQSATPAASAPAVKIDAVPREAAPAQPLQPLQPLQPVPAQRVAPTTPAGRGVERAKRRADKPAVAGDVAAQVGPVRKERSATSTSRPQSASQDAAPAPGQADEGPADPTAPATPPLPMRQKQAEPFPATREREAAVAAAPPPPVAEAPAPAQDSHDAAPARAPGAADRGFSRGTLREAPSPRAALRQAPRAAAVDDAQVQSAPDLAGGSSTARANAAGKPAAMPKDALRLEEKRLSVWGGLEDQPPVKWLERLAQFKREGRDADTEALLAEFRRRFPDYPIGGAR